MKSESEVAQSCPTLSDPPWTTAYQAPPSIGFSRQEYWSGVPLPYPNIFFTSLLVREAQITAARSGGVLGNKLPVFPFAHDCLALLSRKGTTLVNNLAGQGGVLETPMVGKEGLRELYPQNPTHHSN